MKSSLKQILDFKLVHFDSYSIDVKFVLSFLSYLLLALIILFLIKKLLKTATKNNWWIGPSREISVYNSVKIPIILIVIEESLNLFGKSHIISEILNFSIINANGITVTIRKILVFISIILLMRFFVALVEFSIHNSLKKRPWVNNASEYNFVKLISYFLYTIAFFIGIKTMGIDLSLLLGASAVVLVGIGFGLQDIFKDFISGILILFEGNFKVGDIIEYKNTVARVTRIDLRTSRLITRDGNRILIPNSILAGNEIINWSISNPNSRFLVEIGVAYGSDIELVRELLTECANNHPSVNRQNDTTVVFNEFGDSSLNFKLYFWSNKSWEQFPIKSDIRFAIDKTFRENNIRIPFPQRDIHVIELPKENNQTEKQKR